MKNQLDWTGPPVHPHPDADHTWLALTVGSPTGYGGKGHTALLIPHRSGHQGTKSQWSNQKKIAGLGGDRVADEKKT